MAADPSTGAGHETLRGTLPPGTRLRNYELLSVLGHGAFGITYRARDTVLNRDVAIKEYLPSSLALREGGTTVVPRSAECSEDFAWGRQRFLDEARTLVTLDGIPAVIRVHDYLEANGTAYMVMALARGETLEQRLKRDGTLSPPIVERLLRRMLDGLEQVHAAGFLHRDIKPANIILDAKENATLIDFGASRAAMASRTSAMTAVFTPRFAAVEQLTSGEQGPWTDIYGLSATLYFAMIGQAPPTGMERLLKDCFEPLADLRPAGYSLPMLRGIDAGLAIRAEERPQSIADWRSLLAATAGPHDGETVIEPRRHVSSAISSAVRSAPPASRDEDSRRGGPLPEAAGGPSVSKPLAADWRATRGVRLAGAAAVVLVVVAGGYFATRPSPPSQSTSSGSLASEAGQKAKTEAETEALQKAAAAAEAEARRQADEARARALAEQQQKAAAEAEARRQVDEARAKVLAEQQKAAAEAEARRRADEAQVALQKAEAEAQKRAAEAGEIKLQLTSTDRQRLQIALTSLGFDTRGSDGVFGERSREMITAWQKANKQPETGFLTGPQQETLLRTPAAEAARKAAEAQSATKRTATGSSIDLRCKNILQSAQLTGALSDEDRAYLRDRCR